MACSVEEQAWPESLLMRAKVRQRPSVAMRCAYHSSSSAGPTPVWSDRRSALDRVCSAGLSSAQPDSELGLTSGVGAGGQALHAVEAGLDERSVELGFGDGLVGIGHAERAESAVA